MTIQENDRSDRMRALVAEYRVRVEETRSERIQRERVDATPLKTWAEKSVCEIVADSWPLAQHGLQPKTWPKFALAVPLPTGHPRQ